MLIPDHVSLSIPNQVMNLPLSRSLPGLTQLMSHPLFLLVTIDRIWDTRTFQPECCPFLGVHRSLNLFASKNGVKKKDCYTYGMFHDEI